MGEMWKWLWLICKTIIALAYSITCPCRSTHLENLWVVIPWSQVHIPCEMPSPQSLWQCSPVSSHSHQYSSILKLRNGRRWLYGNPINKNTASTDLTSPVIISIIVIFYLHHVLVVHVDGVRLCLWTAVPNRAVVHPQGDWHVSVESHGGMIVTGENRRTRRITCPSSTFSTTNSTCTNSGVHSKSLATNHLSHGMA
jgi:hypothetical protein